MFNCTFRATGLQEQDFNCSAHVFLNETRASREESKDRRVRETENGLNGCPSKCELSGNEFFSLHNKSHRTQKLSETMIFFVLKIPDYRIPFFYFLFNTPAEQASVVLPVKLRGICITEHRLKAT